jgi:SnoaL-like domain
MYALWPASPELHPDFETTVERCMTTRLNRSLILGLATAVTFAAVSPTDAAGSTAAPVMSKAQLLDRITIEALGIDYYYLLDHGQAEKIADLFVETGRLNDTMGREAIRLFYATRSKTRITRHVMTNLHLVFDGTRHAAGTRTLTYYSAEGPMPHLAIPSVAEYNESFEKQSDGRWLFVSRMITDVFSANK